jgi:hypothetical protein
LAADKSSAGSPHSVTASAKRRCILASVLLVDPVADCGIKPVNGQLAIMLVGRCENPVRLGAPRDAGSIPFENLFALVEHSKAQKPPLNGVAMASRHVSDPPRGRPGERASRVEPEGNSHRCPESDRRNCPIVPVAVPRIASGSRLIHIWPPRLPSHEMDELLEV